MGSSPGQGKGTGVSWLALVGAFAGAFMLAIALSLEGSGLRTVLLVVGSLVLLAAIALGAASIGARAAELHERQSWEAFEKALPEGVRFDIPDGMGYAAELPALLDDLGNSGEPSDGLAKHAIVGERGEIHWCAFQHQRPGGTSTIGMVGLRPDRAADSYPRLRVSVVDATSDSFDGRYDVMCADGVFADRVLNSESREDLMAHSPFDWRIEGNQIITTLEEPSTPEQQIAFIEERVEPLARLSARIPLDA